MVIKAKLSESGIQDIIKQLESYRKSDLVNKTNLLAETLAKKGVDIAKANIVTLDAIFTGQLLDSIHTRKEGSAFFIVADSEHAAFVEFGTGLIGQRNPYPAELPPGVKWDYVIGKQLLANIDKGIYGWFYELDGYIYFTEGMPSRPFMYNTTIELMNIVVATAKEVFRV